MPPKEMADYLKPKLLEVCERQSRNFNYIEVKIRGQGMYCVHDFYNNYSLSIGSLAPAIAGFVSENRQWLIKAKINKVGVYGRGEYASGQWYEVK